MLFAGIGKDLDGIGWMVLFITHYPRALLGAAAMPWERSGGRLLAWGGRRRAIRTDFSGRGGGDGPSKSQPTDARHLNTIFYFLYSNLCCFSEIGKLIQDNLGDLGRQAKILKKDFQANLDMFMVVPKSTWEHSGTILGHFGKIFICRSTTHEQNKH